MLPTKTVQEAAVTAMAAAPLTFNPAAGSEQQIVLFKNNITITRNTVLADLELADFGGYQAIECAVGVPEMRLNPVDGAMQIRLREPADGFQFFVDEDVNLPQTIYGFALLDNAGTVLKAAENIPPVELNAINQVIDIGQPIVSVPIDFAT